MRVRKRVIKKQKTIMLFLFILYWLPFLFISSSYKSQFYPQKKIQALPLSDAVIIFGTLVRDGTVSPLLKERLDAGIAIYIKGKAYQIVVSNRKKATIVMQRYLLEKGIPASAIVLDTTAEKTPDTCRYEKKIYPKPRKLIFVSQGYHLARIRYQCKKLDVSAVSFPAENIREHRASLFSSFNVFTIRTKRYFREAGLTWLAFLRVYK